MATSTVRRLVSSWLDLMLRPTLTYGFFSSDGNATMESIASPEAFNKTCGDLIERMINTVPAGVTLTDVVEPIKYELGLTALSPQHHLSNTTDTSVRLSTRLRVMGENPNRKVKLFWKDKSQFTHICPNTGSLLSTPTTIFPIPGSLAKRHSITGFPTYFFEASVNITSSVSKFWFKVNEGDGSPPVLFEPESDAMIKQDTVVFDPIRCSSIINTAPSPPVPALRRIVLTVRRDPSQTNISVFILARCVHLSSVANRLVRHDAFPITPRYRIPTHTGRQYAFPPSRWVYVFWTHVGEAVRWFDMVAEVEGEETREENVMFWV
ncbi:hypothetical protein PM082_023653 [Marasmius tenuissimus]|nr:hypothetical protein PM082_023653 [Marasmius tenuissimus]